MDEELKLALIKAYKVNEDLKAELDCYIRRLLSMEKDFQEVNKVIKKFIEKEGGK